jgi:small-conductance mechanosensitive channel
MIFDQRFKIAFDQSVSNYSENIPWIMVGLAMMVGTLTAVIIIVYFGDKIVKRKIQRKWKEKQENADQRQRQSRRSYGRLAVILFAIVILLGGMTAAFNIMSINFWSIIFGYGIMALVLGQMFASPLRCVGAYMIICFNDKIEEDFWIEIPGQGIEGRVVCINIMDVEIEQNVCNTNDISKLKQFKVPTYMFNDMTIIRKFKEDLTDCQNPDNKIRSHVGLVTSRALTLY